MDAMLADYNLAHLLKIEEGSAVLRMERLTYTVVGKPLDFEYLYFRGDAFQYRLRISRHAANAPVTEKAIENDARR